MQQSLYNTGPADFVFRTNFLKIKSGLRCSVLLCGELEPGITRLGRNVLINLGGILELNISTRLI